MPLRLGLRAQIILALTVVFLISFALLGVAALRLTQRAAQLQQQEVGRIMAGALLDQLAERQDLSDDVLRQRAKQAAARAALTAMEVTRPDGSRFVYGRPPSRRGLEVAREGLRVRLWMAPASSRSSLPLSNLLLFYVSITGLAVLLLAYVALTRTIVRPMQALTLTSERLASGLRDARVQERGAAEVYRLAVAFNKMAGMLWAERQALEARLHELEQTTEELRTTQQQLIHGEKLASVGRLAAGVAHEIGNPIAAILGLVELLQAGDLNEAETGEFLGRIHHETERINRIIRDLLDFSRREAEPEAPGQTADPAQVVGDAVNLVRPQKSSREVRFDVDIAPGIGRVAGAQHRLTQVILNLLLNAVDAMGGSGSVCIKVDRQGDQKVLIRVQDDGPGIAPDMLDTLFEPFTTTKAAGEGTGLGLAVCHSMVTNLGGTIRAQNQPQGGACFDVTLPRAGHSHPPAAPGPAD